MSSWRLRRFDEAGWIEPPGHPGALSKLLANPHNTDSQQFDFRVSTYRPGAMVKDHVHERAEHVYYILSGRGLMTLEGEPLVVTPTDTIFIPPGVEHGLVNNGLADLVFVVVSSPPGDVPMEDVRHG